MAVLNMSGQTGSGAGEGIKVDGLEVSYGGVVALRGISLEIGPGGFVAVLGANGAGKTTLVRTLTGLLPLHKGRVTAGGATLNGVSVVGRTSRDLVKAGLAQVPEGRKLFPRLTVEENLLCGAATRTDKSEMDANLERVFELFPRIHDRLKQQAGYLSGGEQQMVAVGRALMANPRFLICDELSLGLAPMIVSQLFDLLTRVREDGVGVLVIEQNARLALQHTEDAYVIEVGRIEHSGKSLSLRNDPVVQDLYLGGGGEATAAFSEIAARPRRWRR